MASAHANPAFGRWRYGDGRLTITEEGQDYPVDILSLSENGLRIRMHSPGEPVEILFKPAERVAPEAGQDTKTAVVAPASVRSAGISIWTVVAYHNPGISALSGDAARKRYGESVQLTSDAAYSAGQRARTRATPIVPCPLTLSPRGSTNSRRDTSRSAARNRFTGGSFAVEPGLPRRPDSRDRKDALAPWMASFRACPRSGFPGPGQEPGWQLEIQGRRHISPTTTARARP
jgi:hypothetical protein